MSSGTTNPLVVSFRMMDNSDDYLTGFYQPGVTPVIPREGERVSVHREVDGHYETIDLVVRSVTHYARDHAPVWDGRQIHSGTAPLRPRLGGLRRGRNRDRDPHGAGGRARVGAQMIGTPPADYSELLRRRAHLSRRRRSTGTYMPVVEVEEIAAALAAARSLAADDPVEEDPLDLIYRCRHCHEHTGHLDTCPWERTEAALATLERRVLR